VATVAAMPVLRQLNGQSLGVVYIGRAPVSAFERQRSIDS
jgi:hypothetical protein